MTNIDCGICSSLRVKGLLLRFMVHLRRKSCAYSLYKPRNIFIWGWIDPSTFRNLRWSINLMGLSSSCSWGSPYLNDSSALSTSWDNMNKHRFLQKLLVHMWYVTSSMNRLTFWREVYGWYFSGDFLKFYFEQTKQRYKYLFLLPADTKSTENSNPNIKSK